MTRAIAFIVVLALVSLFAMFNWPAFNAPSALTLGVTTVQAPLGLIMLGMLALLCVAFAAWALTLQATALLHARRHSKDLQAQRALADKAEASRIAELRLELMARLDRLQTDSRIAIEQSAKGLAAQLAQIEDRLERDNARGDAAG